MKIFFTLSVMLLIASSILASSGNLSFYHETPIGIIQGEEVTFEVMLTSSNSGLYDMHLFYREIGASNFKFQRMEQDGYLYHTKLNTSNITSGQLQYYIAYEGALGEIGTLPEQSPQISPYAMHIAPARKATQSDPVEILILSPDPNEVIPNDELVIAASLLGVSQEFDVARTKLVIDGTNVTNLIEIDDGVVTFSPNEIRTGYHNVELLLYDAQSNLVGKKEWAFRASSGSMTMGKSYFRGSAFLENRYQDILENQDNFFRAGGSFRGRYNTLDYYGRLVYSSEEANDRQAVNRFAGELQYNFSERNHIYLKGGDITPYYSPLTFYTKRVRGVQTGLAFGFFTFDFIYGQLNREIEGTFTVDSLIVGDPGDPLGVVADTLVGLGTFSESVMAFRPGFRFGDNVTWNLNLINAKEDKGSILYGGNVKESIVTGTDLSMNFDHRRILFDASFQASINNSNAGLEEVEYDSLAEINEDLQDNSAARNYWDFLKSTGMISMTTGLNPLPSLAMHFETTLRYFNNNLNIKYINVESDYATAANPYLLKDVSGFYINDHFRMINNQVLVNLFYNNFSNNKSRADFKTNNGEFGGTITYLPLQNLPSFTLGYMNIDRSNSISPNDSAQALFIEDNSTSKFTFTATYNVDVSNINNAISLNISNFGRSETYDIKKEGENDFTLFGIGLRSKFNIPLTTRINYSQSASMFGSSYKFETDIQRFFLGFEYLWENIFARDFLKPFLNIIFQSTDNSSINPYASSDFTSKRNHYTLGVAYRNSEVGVLSLRFDQIAYQVPDLENSTRDISDTILNVRYQYNF